MMLRNVVRTWVRLGLVLAVALGAFAPLVTPATPLAAAQPVEQAAATSTIYLRLTAARTEPRAFDGAGVVKGDLVTTPYKWLISVDNTGDPDQPYAPDCHPYELDANGAPVLDAQGEPVRNPTYPDNCDWPGIRTVPGWAPVFTQGSETDLSETVGVTLPDGKYLISVMAEGYKVDGEHFTIPLQGDGLLTVPVHPLPLPPSNVAIKVFDDRAMTNGQFDAPVEQGLAGFRASINDTVGEITVDMFGNPLCTTYVKDANGDTVYDAEGAPVVDQLGAGCYSDANGDLNVPNLGTLRFDVLVIPPDGTDWVQTTTLEGSQGWDTWLQEGGTGLDNEFVVAAEPFPWTIFGFVKPDPATLSGTGVVKGQLMAAITASPAVGGLPYTGTIFGGWAGTALHRPIPDGWVALNDLQNGDQAVWVGQAAPDGSFEIPNVPVGNYLVSYWDEKQHYIMDWVQVSVDDGGVTDIGVRTMTNWFTEVEGHVFNDFNENGRRDPGEPGIPNYLVVLKDRDNTEIDRMSISALTDPDGRYVFEKAYPMGSWMVLEAYSDRYHTTGVTYQVWNQPEETTLLGAGVDVDFLPVLGQPVRLDWGVKTYDVGTNGGIVGTVFYDTMRAEDDAAYAGAEPYQPGIPDLTLNLYQTVKDANGHFVKEADGSYKKGLLLGQAVTETFIRPQNCQARDVDGNPFSIPVLPPYDPTGANAKDCLEGPPMGTQIGNEFATLDGNYGFGEGCFGAGGFDVATQACADGSAPTPLPPGDYLVEVETPVDPIFGRPLYQVTREEDVNIYQGDTFTPESVLVAPPACAGPLHIVDVAGSGVDNYPAQPGTLGPSVPVVNPTYAESGGSRFEGQAKPLCDVKLVNLGNGKSIAPIFTFFTEVPIPGKWKGYIIDNLNVSTDPFDLFFGEMAGARNLPIGIYDFTGRLVHTVSSDRHGVYEALLPSVATFNAPTPSGILANVYYIYGNDPGQPGHLNPNYNPQYRSIGTSFEIYPGTINPSDLAPIQNGVGIWAAASQQNALAECKPPDDEPVVFAVSQPWVNAPNQDMEITIYGQGFGGPPTPGSPHRVMLGSRVMEISKDGSGQYKWNDHEIVFTLPNNRRANIVGALQLSVRDDQGDMATNGITMHVRGPGYMPTVYEVGPGRQYDTDNTALYDGMSRGAIQHAVDDAVAAGTPGLVVVYPATPVELTNPTGSHFENVVLHGRVKLQGVGPGGVYADGSVVPGSILDGRNVGGDSAYTTWWRSELLPDIWNNRGGWDGGIPGEEGMLLVYQGAVITVLAKDGEFTQGYPAQVDGFRITGGDQQGDPNIVQNPQAGPVVVQGGGVYVNGYARYLRITNNWIMGNGGAYGGGIRIGTPHIPQPGTDLQNDNLTIEHNRILANGGMNLAGGIGVFAGAADYSIAYNDICGNHSGEYGGGISHYGYSPDGTIHHNRVWFNRSYDEGGGIMIAGELPADPNTLTPGAGPVSIYNNLLQANLANDDGGGLRFLMSGAFQYDVYNNIIVNNISTHEGGGISMWDAPYVNIYNNTIMKNLTTATAMTSNGAPAPAGVATARNSNLLQATLPAGAPVFSKPLLFNNVLWDNRAGTRTSQGIVGIGITGDPFPINHWDVGVSDNSGVLSPTYSLMQTPYAADPTNIIGSDPQVISTYDVSVDILPWRGNTNMVGVNIVAVDLPVNLMGDYHLQAGSPARNKGAITQGGVIAPLLDYDDELRVPARPWDIGADEVR